jgi:hypothetical protein
MKAGFTIFTIIFSIFFTKLSFGNEQYQSCGVNYPCAAGYYCSGSVGEANSGICVANAVNIAICRFVSFVQSDIIKYVGLFAASFAGIYLFIGKFGLITFAQIITGIGILIGAQKLVIQITGSSSGLCTKNQALACLETTENLSQKIGFKNVLNLEKVKDKITNSNCDLLECTRASCEMFTEKTTNGKTQCTKVKDRTEIIFTKQIGVVKPAICNNNLEITCNEISGSFSRDYFKCKNTCTDEIFASEVPSSWNIKNCKELVLKQIKS